MSICRSCEKPIKWIKTKDGRNMPCDPEVFLHDECKNGDKLVTETGHVVSVNSDQSLPNVKGYISHFSTCPEANQWRKK